MCCSLGNTENTQLVLHVHKLEQTHFTMEEFFGSEEALRCFEKSEAIDEKIRQMWTLPNVQVKVFTCCA